LFEEISPDLALLQEVGSIPNAIADGYQVITHHTSVGKPGQFQRISNAILVRGVMGPAIQLTSRWDWVDREIDHFKGNLLAHEVIVDGHQYRALCAYSPAWPIDPELLQGIDVEPVKLTLNPKVWVTELLWAALLDRCSANSTIPWVVGGDLNASETFDYLWRGGPRGNREFLDRMQNLGLRECLRYWNGELVPTFRNPRGGRIAHQMDHLFVSESLVPGLVSCRTPQHERVFGASLSDHLPIIGDFLDQSPGHGGERTASPRGGPPDRPLF
jgi:hypothetical protein